MTVEQNIDRLNYLLKLYNLSREQLLSMLSEGLVHRYKEEDVFNEYIPLTVLKKIDAVFNKGLSYYLNPKAPEEKKETSIFFRKTDFNTELNFGARKTVVEYEEIKLSISALAKQAGIEIKRTLPIYSINKNPRNVAFKLRESIYPYFYSEQKEFLKALINKIADKNVFVFEFIETWNKKDKANIDGFFLHPNVIVLKRQDSYSFRREIYTLIHEFGHYLLNMEEVEAIDYQFQTLKSLNKVEKWCYDFAFYFLLGNYETQFDNLKEANKSNDYNFEAIEEISQKTHLSKPALFTRLRMSNRISYPLYRNIMDGFDKEMNDYKEELKRKRELDKLNNIQRGGGAAKPINSNLLISTVQTAFYEGVIDEYQVCKTLKIKPESLNIYIQ